MLAPLGVAGSARGRELNQVLQALAGHVAAVTRRPASRKRPAPGGRGGQHAPSPRRWSGAVSASGMDWTTARLNRLTSNPVTGHARGTARSPLPTPRWPGARAGGRCSPAASTRPSLNVTASRSTSKARLPAQGTYSQPSWAIRNPASNLLWAPSRSFRSDIVRRTVRNDTPSWRAAL